MAFIAIDHTEIYYEDIGEGPAVAFVHGRLDAEIPLAVARECAALVPGGELIVIEDAGHKAHQDQPLAVNAALRRFVATTAWARHAVC